MNWDEQVKHSQANSVDMENIMGNTNGQILCSAHAVNEQLIFTHDAEEAKVNIFVQLRPLHGFFKRLWVGIGYILNIWWYSQGNWMMFTFDKDEAERLIAFLKKVE